MQVTLDIPEPKFKCGQVVEVKGVESPYHLLVHIVRAESKGEWSFYNGKPYVYVHEVKYTYVHQEGSRDARGGLIRPGTIGVRNQEMEHEGEPIHWDKPIVSEDTIHNLSERKDAWKH